MASQLEIQFQELNNVLERKGTDGGAELENSVIYIPKKVQNNEIQDVITRYGILCISKSYITENASSGDQLNRGVGR